MIKLSKNHPDITGLHWVTEALSKDSTCRPSLTLMKVEKTAEGLLFIATDGHRLHKLAIEDCEDFEPGLYEIIKRTKSELIFNKSEDKNLEYPDYERILPDKNECKSVEICGSKKVPSSGFCKLVRAMSEKTSLNFDYYKEFIVESSMKMTFFLPKKNPHSAMLMECGNYSGVLMPLRVIEDD